MSKPKGTKALRFGRYSGKNSIYHIIARTHNREPMFENFETGPLVVKNLHREDSAGHVKTLAFAVSSLDQVTRRWSGEVISIEDGAISIGIMVIRKSFLPMSGSPQSSQRQLSRSQTK